MKLTEPIINLVLASAIRAAAGLALAKILAHYVSVSEFGRLTQLLGVIALVGMVTPGAMQIGLTRELSKQSIESTADLLCATLKIFFVWSTVLAIIITIGAIPASGWLWGDDEYTPILFTLAFAQIFIGAGLLFQAVTSARSKYRLYTSIVAGGTSLGLITVTAGLILYGAIGGAWGLLANAISQGIVAIAIRFGSVTRLLTQERWWTRDTFTTQIVLLRYAAVPIIGGMSLGIALIAVRSMLSEAEGWGAVAYWQSVSRISDVYMQVLSTIIVALAIPIWARAPCYRTVWQTMWKVIAYLLVGSILFGLGFVGLGGQILQVLYSSEFVAANSLIPFQVVGDTFRVIAVCLSAGLISRGETLFPAAFEALQGPILVIATKYCLPHFGAHAPVVGHVITYMCLALFLAMSWTSRLKLNAQN